MSHNKDLLTYLLTCFRRH